MCSSDLDVIGDSPILRHNQVVRAHALALDVEDFQAPDGKKVQSQPFLDNNNFEDSSAGKSRATVAAQPATPTVIR